MAIPSRWHAEHINFESNSVCYFLESQREVAYPIHATLAVMRQKMQPSTSVPLPSVVFTSWIPKELFIILTARLAHKTLSLKARTSDTIK